MRLRTAGVLGGDLADEPGLRRGEPPAGNLDPQHEGVAPLPLRVEPDPLQALRLPLDAQNRGRTLQRVAVEHRLLDLEWVPGRFPALDLIQLRLLSSRVRVNHRAFLVPSPRAAHMQASPLQFLAVFHLDSSTRPTPSVSSNRSGSGCRTPSSPRPPTTSVRRADRRRVGWPACMARSQ